MSQDCKPPQLEAESVESPSLWQGLVHNSRRIFLGVLRLRRVQMALVTMLVTLLIFYFPMLERLREDLLMIFASLLMVALGGYTVNDALNNGQESGKQERLEDLLEDLVEEMQEEREHAQANSQEDALAEKERVYDAQA